MGKRLKIDYKSFRRLSVEQVDEDDDCIIINHDSNIEFRAKETNTENGVNIVALFDQNKHIWKPAILQQIQTNSRKPYYNVTFRIQTQTHRLNATCISFKQKEETYPIRSRVICSQRMVSGTIAEQSSNRNSDRNLVFFDNGTVGYIKSTQLQTILDSTTLPVERLKFDHIYFLHNYFDLYPERDLIRLKLNQKIVVYLNNKWCQAKVIDLDFSLVKIEFNSESNWMYRGSYCFKPMYDDLIKKVSTDSLNTFQLYVSNKAHESNWDEDKYLESFASTSIPSLDQFIDHSCDKNCIDDSELRLDSFKSINSLLIPMLNNWKRLIYMQINSVERIQYTTPCNRTIRSIHELDKYLTITNSILTIDLFSFDSKLSTLNDFKVSDKYLKIKDITEGKEKKAISCVNCLDKKKPDSFHYTVERVALRDVPLKVNTNLNCCSCEDNCANKAKCACWKRTLKNTDKSPQVGYKSRRLLETIPSGIFECNSNCKCNENRCSNRVVQNGIKARLQVFKTANKGWGVRCLDDIPKGCFISVYAGHLMTEKQANKRSLITGDEYFAELDSVESFKRKKSETFVMDPKIYGNIGRFFNHSCLPNMFVQSVFVDTHDLRFPWTAFFADDLIKAGTELCWDYNYTAGSGRDRKLDCKCGAINCDGKLI